MNERHAQIEKFGNTYAVLCRECLKENNDRGYNNASLFSEHHDENYIKCCASIQELEVEGIYYLSVYCHIHDLDDKYIVPRMFIPDIDNYE